MNERIKELAVEAGMSECALGYGMPENVLWGENQIKKFAQLIIEECDGICYNSGFADSDAHAQNLLFEFNVNGCRDWK